MVNNAYDQIRETLFLQGVYRNRDSTKVYQFQEIGGDSRVVFEERSLDKRRRPVGFSLRDLTQLIPITSSADLDLLRRCGLSESAIPDGSGID
ncbi:MAG: hypothetical protein PHF67_05125 [Candidatus Nanoarchaeia archaeon]|nr:hypothetical protein [Candidatus Nanoarchaeia archaeon]